MHTNSKKVGATAAAILLTGALIGGSATAANAAYPVATPTVSIKVFKTPAVVKAGAKVAFKVKTVKGAKVTFSVVHASSLKKAKKAKTVRSSVSKKFTKTAKSSKTFKNNVKIKKAGTYYVKITTKKAGTKTTVKYVRIKVKKS
jgi:hypothetical protein